MADDDLLLPRRQPPEPTENKPHPWTVWLSVAAIVFAGVSAFYSYRQAYWAGIQAAEAHKARVDAKVASDAQAKDVERSRKAAEGSAAAAGKLADAAQMSLKITDRGAKASERSVEIANEGQRVAERTLQNSIDEFRTERRPWLVVDKTSPDYDHKIAMAVHLTNLGKTPAYRSKLDVSFEYGDLIVDKIRKENVYKRQASESFMSILRPSPILPGDGIDYSLQISGPILQHLDKYSVRLTGLVTYFDSYKQDYHLTLCFEAFQFPTQISLSACDDTDSLRSDY
jgi:hypothetical protein